MRNRFVQIAALGLSLLLMLPLRAQAEGSPAQTTVDDTIIRVGLAYGGNALDGANLMNETGSGFRLGYYDKNNQFVCLGSTGETALSVVKTTNVYYGAYGGYTSYHEELVNAPVAVGCYHLQLPESYSTFEEAQAAARAYPGGFPAYIGGSFYARVGNYTNRAGAEAMQAQLAALEVESTIVGTSAYGVSVVVTGGNTIVFQYDDLGSGTGLGIAPDAAGGEEDYITLFNTRPFGADNNRWYGGFRYERVNGGDLTVVNMIRLGDYVKGVVPHEMSNSWPIEALKAQAVAAKSYALSIGNRHRAYHFDICPTTHCQAYSGLSRAGSNSNAAVDQTEGILATYNGQYAECFYYSSNGGASESSSVVWGGSQANYPYLVGQVDPYEGTITIPGYSWTRSYTGAELASYLRTKGYSVASPVTAVTVSSRTATGNPRTVTFTDSAGKNFTLNTDKLVTMLSLRSYNYDFLGDGGEGGLSVNGDTPVDSVSGLYVIDGEGSVVQVGEGAHVLTGSGLAQAPTGGETGTGGPSTGINGVFTITGKGFGHNVGMSQYGAYAMAQQGYTYDQILSFYYTGITVG